MADFPCSDCGSPIDAADMPEQFDLFGTYLCDGCLDVRYDKNREAALTRYNPFDYD